MNNSGITGIILAGGKSSRMGKDKGLVLFRKKPLIDYAIEILGCICQSIIISANSSAYESLGLPVYHDIIPDSGPMGGIYTCLKHSLAKQNLVLACDMPFVSGDLLNYLIIRSDGFKAVIPQTPNGNYEPLCGFYHKEMVDVLEKLILNHQFKMLNILEESSVKALPLSPELPFYHEELFLNINMLNDLKWEHQKHGKDMHN
jgi:molybdopterin-guanine dinucleotide biosynthesis protein A